MKNGMSTDLTLRPDESILKKHVAMIHVSGSPSFLQKKAANAMHHHAYHELGDPATRYHTIALTDLAEKINFDSKNWPVLCDALKGMVKVVISWDMTSEGGAQLEGVLSYMSEVQIDHASGTCRYAYPPSMRAWLYRPEVYAQINLDVQRAFSSRYALALYENCVRYKDNNRSITARKYRQVTDDRTPAITGWKSLAWWKKVLGVAEGHHTQFRYFRRDVLNPAIKEVSTLSNISLEMHLRRKNRRITDILFAIRPNRTPSLFAPECFLPARQMPEVATQEFPARAVTSPPVKERKARLRKPQRPARKYTEAEQALCTRMRKHGIAAHKHEELLALEKTDPGRIERNLTLLEGIIAEASETIKNPGAWVVTAIRNNYAATMEPEIVREVQGSPRAGAGSRYPQAKTGRGRGPARGGGRKTRRSVRTGVSTRWGKSCLRAGPRTGDASSTTGLRLTWRVKSTKNRELPCCRQTPTFERSR